MQFSGSQIKSTLTVVALSLGSTPNVHRADFGSLSIGSGISFTRPESLFEGTKPFYSFLPQFTKETDGAKIDLMPFRLSSREVGQLINSSVNLVASGEITIEKVPARNADAIGKFIKAKVDKMLSQKFGSTKLSDFEREWAVAEVVCEFVKRTVRYDYDLAKNQDSSFKTKMSLSSNVLEREKAECWGFAVTTRDIARGAGLECYLVNGHQRELGARAPEFKDRNHSVNCFVLGKNRMQVPADVTAASGRYFGRGGKDEFGGPVKVLTHLVLPRDANSWDIFMAKFNSEVDLTPAQKISSDTQNKYLVASYSYDQWTAADTNYLISIETRYIEWEKNNRSSR